jgi:hypothetical protein
VTTTLVVLSRRHQFVAQLASKPGVSSASFCLFSLFFLILCIRCGVNAGRTPAMDEHVQNLHIAPWSCTLAAQQPVSLRACRLTRVVAPRARRHHSSGSPAHALHHAPTQFQLAI